MENDDGEMAEPMESVAEVAGNGGGGGGGTHAGFMLNQSMSI